MFFYAPFKIYKTVVNLQDTQGSGPEVDVERPSSLYQSFAEVPDPTTPSNSDKLGSFTIDTTTERPAHTALIKKNRFTSECKKGKDRIKKAMSYFCIQFGWKFSYMYDDL